MFQVVIKGESDEELVCVSDGSVKQIEHSITEISNETLGHDVDASPTQTTNFSDGSDKRKRNFKKKFRAEWCFDPLFEDWLLEKDGQAFCKNCQIILAPGKSELLRHGSTRKHLKTLETPSSFTVEDNAESYLNIDLRWEPGSRLPLHFSQTVKNCKPSGDIREDVHTKELEIKIAMLTGKEEGVWFSSPAVANLTCFSCYEDSGSTQVIVGSKSQMALVQRACLQTIPSIRLEIIDNQPDGSYCLSTFQEKIKKCPDSYPGKSIATIEQTHLRKGGIVVPVDWEQKLHSICREHNIDVHMDGVDLYGASECSKRSIEEITESCKTVTVRTPVFGGAVLVGPSNLIKKARKMRNEEHYVNNSGVMTSTEVVSLELAIEEAEKCRLQARHFGAMVRSRKGNIAWLAAEVHTNIVLITVNTTLMSLRDFVQGLCQGSPVMNDRKRKRLTLVVNEHPPDEVLLVFTTHVNKYEQYILDHYAHYIEKLELIISDSIC